MTTSVSPAKDSASRVAHGWQKCALAYYDVIGNDLGLSLNMLLEGAAQDPNARPQTNVNDILDFLGYRGLSAHDLEVEPPARLMPESRAAFDALADEVDNGEAFKANLHWNDFRDNKIVAVRYFSPKVADYTRLNGGPMAGWRKLVRLTSRRGSQAAAKGIGAAYLLFSNQIGPPPDGGAFGIADIFPTRAMNDESGIYAPVVQMILERAHPADGKDLPSLYFLTFDGRNAPTKEDGVHGVAYGLLGELRAKFDLPGVNGSQTGRYYVPSSCGQCHGTGFSGAGKDHAMMETGPYASHLWLNYLDTDQWYDARDADFRSLIDHHIPVLIDMTPAQSDAQRRIAFDRFTQMNLYIRAQNVAACDRTPCQSLQVRAVSKWLALHATDPERQSIWKRALTPLHPQDQVWSEADANDRALLPMLDHYCTRCHLNMFFAVFDKQTVANFAADAVQRLGAGVTPAFTYKTMPQGRKLNPSERDGLIRYLKGLDPLAGSKTGGSNGK